MVGLVAEAFTEKIDLLEYEGQYVEVEVRKDGAIATTAGTIGKATPHAIFLKAKSGSLILELDEIVSITVVESNKSKRIEVRYLNKGVSPDNVRQHLADRHGIPLDQLPTDPSVAMELHREKHSVALGHEHGPKPTRHKPTLDEVADRAQALDTATEADEFEEDYVDEE